MGNFISRESHLKYQGLVICLELLHMLNTICLSLGQVIILTMIPIPAQDYSRGKALTFMLLVANLANTK